MSLNPIQFGEHVVEQFQRYLLTYFPIADQGMEAQVREHLSRGPGGKRELVRRPYIHLNRPFEPGPALADLVGLGGQLVALHLMESDELDDGLPSYPVAGDNLVEPTHPKYFAPGDVPPAEDQPLTEGRVYINRTKKTADAPAQYFEGIEPEVWEFQVGGYPVLGKWLKDRKGRELSPDDLEHYRRVVVSLRATIEVMATIDARIEDWPIT